MKKLRKKIYALVSVVAISATLPFGSVNALAKTQKSDVIGFEEQDGLAVKNLITQEEKFISKGEYDNKLMGDSAGYIPGESKIKKPFVGAIIGTDERTKITDTTKYPYRAICRLVITFPDGGTYVGSAAMVGDDVALTAGHCVYSSSNGGWATRIQVIPGANGSATPYETAEAAAMTAPSQWRQSTPDYNYDWGVLKLNKAVGNTVGYFGSHWGGSSLTGMNVTVTGYPGEKSRTMWTMSGDVTSCSDYRFSYTLDTTGGQSGSPVYWYNGTYGYQIVGIHNLGSSSSNSATRMTSKIREMVITMDEMALAN